MRSLRTESVVAQMSLDELRELATFGALSDAAISDLLAKGTIWQRDKGDVFELKGKVLSGFFVVLSGDIAWYQHCEDRDVMTRHFRKGEQMGFDAMIGMRPCSGTEVPVEPSLVLEISSDQFFQFHLDFPADFGLLMINLSRELSREIAMLEGALGKSTGWQVDGD